MTHLKKKKSLISIPAKKTRILLNIELSFRWLSTGMAIAFPANPKHPIIIWLNPSNHQETVLRISVWFGYGSSHSYSVIFDVWLAMKGVTAASVVFIIQILFNFQAQGRRQDRKLYTGFGKWAYFFCALFWKQKDICIKHRSKPFCKRLINSQYCKQKTKGREPPFTYCVG